MNVLAYDSHPNDKGRDIAEYVELDEIFAKSDVISLHCPLFPSTEGIINKDNIARMKDGVIIINNSRGQLIVEKDLLERDSRGLHANIADAGREIDQLKRVRVEEIGEKRKRLSEQERHQTVRMERQDAAPERTGAEKAGKSEWEKEQPDRMAGIGLCASALLVNTAVHHVTSYPSRLFFILQAVFFAGIFAVRYAQNKGILILPMWINVLSAAGLLILISSFCLVQALITVQMKQKPEPDCEYLLILGCRVRGLEITKSLRYRLDAALAYLEQNEKHSKDNTQNKTIRIIVSGGQGPGEDISEAQAMKDYLCAHGIEASRIFMEAQSTDTEKNIAYSARFIPDKNAKIGVVSNDFHLFRAGMLVRAKGFHNVSTIAARSDEVLFLNYRVREYFGVLKDLFGVKFFHFIGE